jgi:hypothetical protein
MWHAWERRRFLNKVLIGKPEGKRLLGSPRRRGRMGSVWILGRLAGGVWSGLSWLRIRTGGRYCEYDDEHSVLPTRSWLVIKIRTL